MEDDASEYSEERIEERFVEDAFNYKLKNKKRYYKIMEVIDSGFTSKDFYMMHLIRERFKDDRNIDNEYQRQYKEKQRRLLQILSEKGEDKTR